ncbi:DUF551 domain-containing protein [Pluralibacter gergoviae]|uniref:DUF551 domain-containing protein n=1 Tax=Pluralibacter gergoviae TaxID=61647 RepID=UPI000A58E4ED|nr:DUF551 domain-containing protein [Pluralibacter gergoviae]
MKHLSTKAIRSVVAEMNRQDEKWGADRDQHPFVWQTILSEEVGEFSQAILHDEFGGHKSGTAREEMVQIAAVALQIVEYYDRQCATVVEFQKEAGWIDFNESVPDKLTPVIVMYADGKKWAGIWSGERWDDGLDSDEVINITHWQPMPPTPERW